VRILELQTQLASMSAKVQTQQEAAEAFKKQAAKAAEEAKHATERVGGLAGQRTRVLVTHCVTASCKLQKVQVQAQAGWLRQAKAGAWEEGGDTGR